MKPDPKLAASLRRRRSEVITACYEQQFGAEMLRRFPNTYAEKAVREEVEQRYLGPLLDMLIEYARTGHSHFRHLYLAGWRRYAPHRDGGSALRDYYAAILPLHEEAIAGHGADAESIRRWLTDLHRPLLAPPAGRRLCLLTIGDCLLSEVQAFLLSQALSAGLDLDVRYYYFSAVMKVDLAQDGIAELLRTGGVDMIATSYLTYEGIPLYRSLLEKAERGAAVEVSALIHGIVQFMRTHLGHIRELTEAPVLLHNASGLPLTRWRRLLPWQSPISRKRKAVLTTLNEEIARLADEIPNCFLMDEAGMVEKQGLRACGRPVLPAHIRRHADSHPAFFGQHLAAAYFEVLQDFVRLRKTKVLLVDFDNTLWHGVMADGPVLHRHDRQQLLKRLSEQGILLVALSKNDPANIRWDEITLRPEDFVTLKISWSLKADSIREVAAALNLGFDSFTLIDDNPAELELVRQTLPDVQALNATEPESWDALARLFRMPNTRLTDEARQRTHMYRQQAERSAVLSGAVDYGQLMTTLELRATIGPARESDLDRVAELVQRTNQFNTTTIRYTRGQLRELLTDPAVAVYVGELRDKFGALGVVCTAVVRTTLEGAVIESFVMSCRAMGFGMEHAMLSYIRNRHSADTLIGRFVPTDRNEPASMFFSAAGFERSNGSWALPANRQIAVTTPWLVIQDRGSHGARPARQRVTR